MTNPRVAIVTHGYLDGGGVPAVTSWLSDGVQERGFEVDVHDLATSRSDPLSRRVADPRTWHRPVRGPATEFARGRVVFHWGCGLAEYEPSRYAPRADLTRELSKYDLIQVVAGAPAWANVVRDLTVPKVLQVATTTEWERASRLPHMALGRRLWAQSISGLISRMDASGVLAVDHVMVENRMMQDWVAGQGQQAASLTPPGIATDLFRPLGTWSRESPVVALGRLGESRKGWGRLLRAYDVLRARRSSTPGLVLAGRGFLGREESAILDGLAHRDAVHVESDIDQDALICLLQGASVFVQASHEEGLGIAGLEAMACGVPMVATDTAGTREYLDDGVNGFLVPQSGDVVAGLAEGISLVLDGHGERMSIEARVTVVERYSSEKCLDQVVSLYRQLLGS